ncbi:MAG: protein phosphatase 2C domain-containing protein [Candidatus Micrarchaeota archaeon]
MASPIESRAKTFRTAAGALMDSIRAKPPDYESLSCTMRGYRDALRRLADLIPGRELWVVERDFLPEDIRNQRLAFGGLPETLVPFSPSCSWTNAGLEAMLGTSLPTGYEHAHHVRVLARLLDRYVECAFPMQDMNGFYRGPVSELSGMHGMPGYEAAVVGLARSLVERSLPSLLATNINLLKLSLHKSIWTETGVELGERDSGTPRHSMLRLRPSLMKRWLQPTIAGRAGVGFDSESIARAVAAAWGMPAFDNFPLCREEAPEPASKGDLAAQLQFVLRSGRPLARSHIDLPGFEFSPEKADEAALHAAAAQRLVLDEAGGGGASAVAVSLGRDAEFIQAAKAPDLRAMMRIALEAVALEERVRVLAPSMQEEDARTQAHEDLRIARDMIAEYRALKESPGVDPGLVPRGVRMMQLLSKSQEFMHAPDYEIAMAVVDERRGMRESFTTLQPPPPDIAPQEPPMPQAPKLPSGVAEPEVVPLPSPETATRLEEREPPAPQPQAAAEVPVESPAHPSTIEEALASVAAIELTFPYGNPATDAALEAVLPPKTDARAALIRQAARNLRMYLELGVAPADSAPCFRDSLERLRQAPTHEGIVSEAAVVVDAYGLAQLRSAEKLLGKPSPAPAIAPEAPPAQVQPEAQPQDEAEVPGPPQASAQPVLPEESQPGAEAPEAAPQMPGLPKFDFPFTNDVLDAELEPLLPPRKDESGKDIERNVLVRRVARALVRYVRFDFHDDTIEARCLPAVKLLRRSYSPGLALGLATALVDREPLPVPEDAPQQKAREAAEAEKAKKGAKEIFDSLLLYEKNLVAEVMGRKECDEFVLAEFLKLDAGRRELIIRELVADTWLGSEWKAGIAALHQMRGSLYQKCGLAEPSTEEKLLTVTNPQALTATQKHLVASLFDIKPEAVTAGHIQSFGVWLRGDEDELLRWWDSKYSHQAAVDSLLEKMRAGRGTFSDHESSMLAWVLGKTPPQLIPADFQRTGEVKAMADYLHDKCERWFSPSKEERLQWWRHGMYDLLTASSLAHKLRFVPDAAFTPEETALASRMLGKRVDLSSLAEDDHKRLWTAFVRHTSNSHYIDEVLKLASLGPAMHHASLIGMAKREAEFVTLADFLGADARRPYGSVGGAGWGTLAKNDGNGKELPNEDSCSSAEVEMPDGSRVILDMVADGMGGHNTGTDGSGRTNGQRASAVAKEVFELAAVAGWISTPEDARRTILLADLAVVMEQIRSKASADDSRENDMGSTITIAMQHNDRFWGIHCGDSDWKILREGEAVFSSVGHSSEWGARQDLRLMALAEVGKAWADAGHDVERLDGQLLQQFDAQVEARTDEIFQAHSNMIVKGGVAAALGHIMPHVHVNNSAGGYDAFTLRPGDILALCSDGMGVPICDHEFGIFISQSGSDLTFARDSMIAEAARRVGKSSGSTKEHPTLCTCRTRPGKPKPDDITLKMRYVLGQPPKTPTGISQDQGPAAQNETEAADAEPEAATAAAEDEEGVDVEMEEATSPGAVSYPWVAALIHDDPRGFAVSAQYRGLLDLAMEKSTGYLELGQIFDVFIEAAESAPPKSSMDAHTIAICTVFAVVSQRDDRDKLLELLRPRIGSWSGLIMKKLKNAPDSSQRRRAMFDFVAGVVPAEELAPLARARNPEVARWAKEAMGMSWPEPESEPGQEARHSIFNSQTDVAGNGLDMHATRYLDGIVLDVGDSAIVQDVAAKLGILPRDLEIMVFYAYSDFNPQMAVDPHMSVEGQELIPGVSMHLLTGDAERILKASFLIYALREGEPKPEEAAGMRDALWKVVRGMDQLAPYALPFHNKAYLLGPPPKKIAGTE